MNDCHLNVSPVTILIQFTYMNSIYGCPMKDVKNKDNRYKQVPLGVVFYSFNTLQLRISLSAARVTYHRNL